MEKSRTEYSARNATIAMMARVTAIVAGYLTRVVLTHTLSESYVGINGLFLDILNVLALSELGVGTAITYALYRPISENDVEKQKSLMMMYRKFYRIVAIIVLGGGLSVIPFMDILIKNPTDIEHLTFIYLMYLTNSVLSYLLIYKKTLIDAHQLSYIGVLYKTIFLILQNILQMLVLVFTRNFILYVSLLVICTIANNICISRKADRMYPYLRDRDAQELPKKEKHSIYQNIRAMLMHKIGNVIVSNTDNLLLSSIVGIVSVGKYTNYYLIIVSVRQVLDEMFQSITASVGNLGVMESRERIRRIFEASFFMGQWMFGLMAICLFEVVDSFVEISFGAQYVFSREITLVLCLNFYITGMRQAVLVFRDSMGMFRYDRYKSLAEAIINLVVSIVLGRYLGTAGIFLGTLVSTVTTSLWVEPYMLYKHCLGASSVGYFLHYALYAAVTFLLWFGEDLLCQNVTGDLRYVCIIRLLICFAVTNLAYLLLFHRMKEFRLLVRKAWGILQQKYPWLCRSAQVCGNPGKQEKEFSLEEACLLSMIKRELTYARASFFSQRAVDWEMLAGMAKRHEVLSLLYGVFSAGEDSIPGEIKEGAAENARKIAMQNYRLLFLCKYLTGKLEGAGISVVILKGAAAASYYPVPELRKSGDVDLLLPEPGKLEEACRVLEHCGFAIKERQPALHHVVFSTEEGIAIELHTMLAEPFDNSKMNRYLQETLAQCREQIVRTVIMGVELPILAPGYHAYELLLHMLQHFLRSGFGLKLLCDWVVFWNHGTGQQERQKYMELVTESRIKGFSDIVTAVCCRYLGLRQEAVCWMELPEAYETMISKGAEAAGGTKTSKGTKAAGEIKLFRKGAEEDIVREFMAEVLEAEEFGKSALERMVLLRSTGVMGYVREFHHQMRLNFPVAGRCFLCWPALWMITLIRFWCNNHRIRKVSMGAVLRNAGQRSRLIAGMKLWK